MCSTIIDNSNSDVININRENLLALYVCLKNRLINLKASLESEPEPKVGRASVCLCRQTCYYCCQCRRRSLSLRSAEMSLVTRGRHRCLVVTSARLRPWLAPALRVSLCRPLTERGQTISHRHWAAARSRGEVAWVTIQTFGDIQKVLFCCLWATH